MKNTVLKKIASQFLYTLGITAIRLNRKGREEYVILMYHRVLAEESIDETIQPGMYIKPQTLEMQISYLKRRFSIQPLRRLKDKVHEKHDLKKKMCFLTFDDGWKDFYDHAFPILEKQKIHATVFLPTGFIGSSKTFWPDQLLRLMKKVETKKYEKPINVGPNNPYCELIERFDIPFEERAENVIQNLKQLKENDINEILNAYSKRWATDIDDGAESFLSWDDVLAMKESGLIDFGSHTVGHQILTNLKNDEIKYEIEESKRKLTEQKAADARFLPFCYPSGMFDGRTVQMVKDAGYDVAVTTQKGWNSSNSSPFTLKRIGIHNDMTSSEAMFACRIAGIF
jgi:peptidoglycan/xylan/chitin deacetylase (PgdA/CDA1 family)